MTTGLFFSALAVVLGILCIIFTDFSIKIIVILLGATAFVKGVFDFIKFRSLIKEDSTFHRAVLIRCLVSIVVGVIAVSLPMAFFKTAETVIHVMLYILGVYFLFCAISGLFIISRMKRAELPTKVYNSSTIIYLLIAILLFLLATIGMKNILRGVGVGLAVCGAVGCVYSWRNRPQELKPDAVVDVTEPQAQIAPEKPSEPSTDSSSADSEASSVDSEPSSTGTESSNADSSSDDDGDYAGE